MSINLERFIEIFGFKIFSLKLIKNWFAKYWIWC